MKKTFLCFCLTIFSCYLASGQDIQGIIYYQNSGGKTASGVQVSAFGCNSVYSLSNGMFALPCPQKKSGQKLKLILGNVDDRGNAIEVVNTRQLEWLRLPDKSDADPIEIIVCYAGQKDETALHFYGILSKSVSTKFEEKLTQLESQIKKSNLGVEEHKILLKQIEQTTDEKDEALKKVEEQAEFMASINIDQASSLVKDALQMIESKENIDSALTILNNIKLKEAFNKTYDIKIKAEREISNIIEAYKLRVSLLESQFRYKEALDTYDEVFNLILQSRTFTYEAFELIDNYFDLLDKYGLEGISKEKYIIIKNHRNEFIINQRIEDNSKLEIALRFALWDSLYGLDEGEINPTDLLAKLDSIINDFSDKLTLEDVDIHYVHNFFAWMVWLDSLDRTCFNEINNNAEKLSQECLQVADSAFYNHSALFGEISANSNCRFCMFELYKVQIYGYKNDSIYIKMLLEAENRIVNQYANCVRLSQYIYPYLIKYYFEKGDSVNGEIYIEKAIQVLENAPDSLYEDVAEAYLALYEVTDMGFDFDTDCIHKAINKLQDNLNKNDPKLIPFYLEMAYLLEDTIELSAIEWYKKALVVQEKVYHQTHEDIATTYRDIGNVYYSLSDSNYFKALDYFKKCNEIYLSKDKEISQRIKNVNERIGKIYFFMHDYEYAMHYLANGTFGCIDSSLLCDGMKIRNLVTLINEFIFQTDEELSLFGWSSKDTLDAIYYIDKLVQDYERYKQCMHPNSVNNFMFYEDVLFFLGDLYLEIKQHDKAKNIFSKFESWPEVNEFNRIFTHAKLSTRWIRFNIETGNDVEVIKILEAESNKGNAYFFDLINKNIHSGLSKYYPILYDKFSLIDYFLKAIKIENMRELAREAFSNKDYYTAALYYDTLNMHYDDYDNMNFFGLCNYYNENYSVAIEAYKKSFLMDTLNTQRHLNNIGMAYVKNNQFKKAQAAFIEYQKLCPNEGRPYRNWAMYYALKGNKEKALQNLQKAIDLGYSDLEWLKTDESMDGLREEKVFIQIIEDLGK